MFSVQLKILRDSMSLSQRDFASKIGVAPSTVGMWESGQREPDFEMTLRLARFFGVSVDYLLGVKEEKPQFDNIFSDISKSGVRDTESQNRFNVLAKNFDRLNSAGQDRMIEYSNLLALKEEYRNSTMQLPNNKRPESVSGETVRVFRAARSTDNTPPEWVNMPAEEVERIFNAPESDADF